ncbi:MAG: hypothetical protein IKT52_01390 [Oscillospiraceae bacterium]|nr:hypothetical protein [Oscillospiraceae bacterium]
MKKNRMMRLASVLLVLTLLTTSVISGTFAKYTTTDSASDSARVAKWGIDVTVGGNLFGQYYDANGATNSDKIVASSTSVASFDDDNLVAPGTKNDTGFEVKITGTPEVAYTIDAKTGKDVINVTDDNEEIFLGVGEWGTMVAVTGLNDATDFNAGKYYTLSGTTFTKATGYVANTQYYELHDEAKVETNSYYPIVWSLTKGDTASTATRLADIATEMITNVEAKAGNANADAAITYKLTWEWPFSSTNNANDGVDTILGNLMAGDTTNIVVKKSGDNYTSSSSLTDGTDYNLDVKFAFEVTVTQVD